MSLSSDGSFGIAQLRSVLENGLDQVAVDFRDRWGSAGASFERSVVFHGTGQLGQESLRMFRNATGHTPVAFTDNDSTRWGSQVNGVEIMGPAAAIDRWGETGVFVATLYNPAAVMSQLRDAGASVVVPWHWMFAADEEHFLPYWGLDIPERVFAKPDRVLAAAEVWADDRSQQIYLEQLRWLMTLDSDALSKRLPLEDAYFDPELIELSGRETFVDCGAFDGDSFSLFRQRTSGQFEAAYLIEPDPENYEELNRWHGTLSKEDQSRIMLSNCALGRQAGVARFAAKGEVDSSLDEAGELEVTVCSLDSLVPASDASFVKVDVEGGEIDLIGGASEILAEKRSTWTVMAYHRPDHLWEIPLELAQFGGRDLHIRRYAEDCWERCIYAVPQR
jgi:FkbM family methyltransferase